jgi:hypothetical protein
MLALTLTATVVAYLVLRRSVVVAKRKER